MPIDTPINLDYLIPTLRQQLGDTDPASYRYVDGWLRSALVTAVKSMQRWWKDKYLVDSTTYDVYRNTAIVYEYDEPPLIQDKDERPLILMASILVKSGQLERNSWSVGSWKDAEIAVSTIAGGDAKKFSYSMDWEELKMYILPPTKKLFMPTRNLMPDEDI